MSKLINSKKAIGIDDFIPLIFAVLVFLFAVIFLFASDKSDKEDQKEDIQSIQEEIYAADNLMNFLQLSYNEDLTNADLAIAAVASLSAESKEYKDFEQKAKDFFDPLYSVNEDMWKLYINQIPSDALMAPSPIFEIKGSTYSLSKSAVQKARSILPVPENKPVELRLFTGK